MDTINKLDKLKNQLIKMERVIIAFSGGIDSTLLLKVAHETLGDDAIGLTLISKSIPTAEIEAAKQITKQIGVHHVLLHSNETEDPDYKKNTPNRCYFCRRLTYQKIFSYAQTHEFNFVLDGANVDDSGDHRPGRRAAYELGVRSPLQEVGLTKSEIRKLSLQYNLPNWDKPSAACLSSRIPYGIPISSEILSQIEQAENKLIQLGFKQCRVRHHNQIARIEVPSEQFPKMMLHRKEITKTFKDIGYKYITLDLEGFRSGSLNEVL